MMNGTIRTLMDKLSFECHKAGTSLVCGVASGENSSIEYISVGNSLDMTIILNVGIDSVVELTGVPFTFVSDCIRELREEKQGGATAYEI